MVVKTDELVVLWHMKWRIVATSLLAGVTGFGLATVLPRTYESELNLQIGRVFGQVVEDPYAFASYVGSDGFRAVIEAEVGQPLPRRYIQAEVVDGGYGQFRVPAYISVTTRGTTAEDAQALGKRVQQAVAERHRELFEEALNQHNSYQAHLSSQIADISKEIAAMQSTLEGLRTNPGVGAPAILLLQGQVETRQAQLLQFRREQRDSQIQQAVQTHVTRSIAPPRLPRRPVWPMRSLFALAAAFLGGGAAVLLSLLRR